MHRAKLDQNIRIIKLAFDAEKRPAEIHSLLRTLDQPRAIFCWSDIDAIHVLDSAKRLGIKVPEELALIGYDNSSPAALASIALSSIEQSGKRLGALAAEILLSRIGGRNIASHLLIEPSLICRQTD